MKTYQMYHSECLQAETKLRQAETQRVKVEQQQNVGGVTGAKNAISRRFRNYEKVSEKVRVLCWLDFDVMCLERVFFT